MQYESHARSAALAGPRVSPISRILSHSHTHAMCHCRVRLRFWLPRQRWSSWKAWKTVWPSTEDFSANRQKSLSSALSGAPTSTCVSSRSASISTISSVRGAHGFCSIHVCDAIIDAPELSQGPIRRAPNPKPRSNFITSNADYQVPHVFSSHHVPCCYTEYRTASLENRNRRVGTQRGSWNKFADAHHLSPSEYVMHRHEESVAICGRRGVRAGDSQVALMRLRQRPLKQVLLELARTCAGAFLEEHHTIAWKDSRPDRRIVALPRTCLRDDTGSGLDVADAGRLLRLREFIRRASTSTRQRLGRREQEHFSDGVLVREEHAQTAERNDIGNNERR